MRKPIAETIEGGVEVLTESIKGRKYIVFKSRSDFEKHFMAKDGIIPPLVENWRLSKDGDWTIADDGGVCEIITRKPIRHPNDTKNYSWAKGYVRTVVGSFIIRKERKMDTDFHSHKSRYSLAKKPDTEKKNKRTYLTRQELFFAICMVAGLRPKAAYVRAFKYYGSKAEDKAYKLMRSPMVMDVIKNKLKGVAKDKGLNYEWLLENLKGLAESSRRDDVRFNAICKIGTYIGADKEADREEDEGLSFAELPGNDEQTKQLESLKRDGEKAEDAEIEDIAEEHQSA